MSKDIITGRKASKIFTVMAAVFAVALMLAVPILTAVDTDASFTDGDAGIVIDAKDPTSDEMTKYGLGNKESRLVYNTGTRMFSRIFNVVGGPFDIPAVTMDSFSLKTYIGAKVESDRTESIAGDEISAEGVKIVYTALANGKLIL